MADYQTPIPVTPEIQTQTPIPYDTGVSPTARVAPEQAKDIAWKAKFALPTWDKPYQDIVDGLVSGNEDQIRQEAASHVNMESAIADQEKVIKAMTSPSLNLNSFDATNLISSIVYRDQPAQPETVLQEYYGKQYIDEIDRTGARNPDTVIPVVEGVVPDYVQYMKDAGSTQIAQIEIAKRILKKTIDNYENQGWGSWFVDQMKPLIPGYTNFEMRGLADGRLFAGFGSDLLGSDIENQISALNTIRDPKRYQETLEAMVSYLMVHNPGQAVALAKAAVGRSTSERDLDNLMDVADLTYIGQAAKLGLKTIKNLAVRAWTKKVIKDALRSTSINEPPSVAMAAGTGDAAEAGVRSAADTITKDLTGELDPASEALNSVTSHLRYDGFLTSTNPSRNYREMATRLVGQYTKLEDKFREMWKDVVKVDRLSAFLRVEANVRKLKEELKGSLPGLDNSILDISKPYKNELGTGWKVDFHIGDNNGQHFVGEENAAMWARLHGLSNYIIAKKEGEVVSEGGMHYLKITKPLTETDDVIRDGLLATEFAQSPGIKKLLDNPDRGLATWFTSWTGKYRNPDEVLSLAQRLERKNAAYGASVLQKLAKEESKPISDLTKGKIKTDTLTGDRLTKWNNKRLSPWMRKKRFSDWERVVNAASSIENPVTGKLGYNFKSPYELEDFYLQHIKRLPDDVEIEAYFAQKRLDELDHMYRNIRVWTNKHRAGVETHTINALDEGGHLVKSPEFDGTLQNFIPRSGDTIAIFYENGTKPVYKIGSDTAWLRTKEYKNLTAAVEKGEYKVIRQWSPELKELQGFGTLDLESKRPVYIIAKNIETKPISFLQVPRQEGGHHIYDYGHFIKQAKMMAETIGKTTRHIYLGDSTIMPIRIRAMGRDIAEKLDKVREFLRRDKVEDARAYARNNLPMSWDEIHGWFLPSVHAETGVKHPPLLNLTEKIQVVPAGKRISDVSSHLKNKYQGSWKDGTKSGSLASQYEVEFTGERDNRGLRTIVNKGTATNPVYEWTEAKRLDPIPTVNRAMNRIINSLFMDDYKIMSAEHWLQEAIKAGVLRPGKDEIRSAPFYHFIHPEYENGIEDALRKQFEATNYQIRQMWGQQTGYQRFLQSATQRLMDATYNTFGEGRILAIADWALPYAQDPLSVFRTFTFHAKLGIFAIPQLLVQAQTYSNIFALAGGRPAGAGTAAAMFRQYARINKDPAFVDMLDKKLASMNLGWKPGEFKDAMEWLKRTGFENIQGEYAMLDSTLNTQIIRTRLGEFLDLGATFFREGERNARYGAWFTAYHEFRNGTKAYRGAGGKLKFAGKEGRLTEEDAKMILERADTLYGNMSRASSSALHTGIFSWTSQFLSYQIRLAEQMTGKRLTSWERARMVGVNAALYGLPAATGLSGVPIIGDHIREWALNHGYVVGENWVKSLLLEGIPALLAAYVSGSGDLTDVTGRLHTGNWFNVGPRLGNSGFEWIRDIYRGDKSVWTIVGGAPGSTLAGTIASADPFMKMMWNFMKGDFEGKEFPASYKDLLDVFNEVSTVSRTRKMLAAFHTGRWLSSKETFLMDNVSPAKAIFMWLTGLQDQAIDDIWHKNSMKKEMDELEKVAATGFRREYSRFLQALKDNQPDQATAYLTRAKYYLVVGGLPEQRQNRVMGQAMSERNNRALIDTIDWDYYINSLNVPQAKREEFFKTYQTIQKMKKEKEAAQ